MLERHSSFWEIFQTMWKKCVQAIIHYGKFHLIPECRVWHSFQKWPAAKGASCFSGTTGCYRLVTIDWSSKISNKMYKKCKHWNLLHNWVSVFPVIMLLDNSLKVEDRLPLQKSKHYVFPWILWPVEIVGPIQ